MKSCDIVINGAGIPGLLLALLLVREAGSAKPKILLLDRQQPQVDDSVHAQPQTVQDFDLRVFAITEASRQLFERAGAWPQAAQRIYPYQHMHVWDAGGKGSIHFDAAEIGVLALGYIAEGRVLHDLLVRQLQQENSIEILAGDELQQLEEDNDHLQLTLKSGNTVNARLLVGADGARSHVRQLAGIESVGWAYGQQAVVATVATEHDHQSTAWQRFLPEGPLAFLPMQKPWCSIVWSVSEHRAGELCQLDDEGFLRILTGDFAAHLGAVTAVGPRAKFPLRLSHARAYTAPRLALVADAAHTVHPLAGQGLNLGLHDVASLAEQLLLAWQAGKDIGSRRVLRAYERSRKGDNWMMQASFDGLKRLFSNDQSLLTQLRNTGLTAVDRLPMLKNAFVRKAMGL